MKYLYHKILFFAFMLSGLTSCNKFLDIVPDNVATIENAFALRSEAKKYLYTCYSYIQNPGSISYSPSFLRGEIWPMKNFTGSASYFVRGQQNVVDPYLNFWDGRKAGTDYFQALRDCNIFLENIQNVPDMEQGEEDQWEAEVKFLKGWYTFYLARMYGPIPLIRKNLPIDASIDEVRVRREPVDSVFNYIEELFDEAIDNLPDLVLANMGSNQYGRITKSVAMSAKALVLVTAASPLFNGNTDYANYKDEKYGNLFNQEYSQEKWEKAMIAAKEAIENCEKTGFELYRYQEGPGQNLSDTTIIKLNIRKSVTERKPKVETIWGNTGAWATQTTLTPRTWDPDINISATQGRYGPTINVVRLFYTDKGLPINEDKTWDYANRFDIKTATEADRYNIFQGYQTAALHFGREPRLYASTGFDGGIWYGQGKFDDNDSWHLEGRAGGYTSAQIADRYSPTGYWPKKLINIENELQPSKYSVHGYTFPIMRLAGLYLLYAEAANEYEGPGDEVYKYLNRIRDRAGLPTVQESWSTYSVHSDKYKTKDGLREIIRREREIELMYEGKRYWDLLRWKTAEDELSEPVLGWNIREEDPELYYSPVVLYQGQFKKRDYFWPIREATLQKNTNLLQSPGW